MQARSVWEGKAYEEIPFLALFLATYLQYILAILHPERSSPHEHNFRQFLSLFGKDYHSITRLVLDKKNYLNTFKSQRSSIKLSSLLAPIICIFLHFQGLELTC